MVIPPAFSEMVRSSVIEGDAPGVSSGRSLRVSSVGAVLCVPLAEELLLDCELLLWELLDGSEELLSEGSPDGSEELSHIIRPFIGTAFKQFLQFLLITVADGICPSIACGGTGIHQQAHRFRILWDWFK